MNEQQAQEFLRTLTASFFRTGSREICDPPVQGTDVDYVLLVTSWADDDKIAAAGFVNTSEAHEDTYGGSGPFTTFRLGEVNLIVTGDDAFFDAWKAATLAAKRMNMLDKHERIAFFQGILYGNWHEWIGMETLS